MAESLGLEEANRIRVAMGLKAIPIPGVSNGPVFKNPDNDIPGEEQRSTIETRSAAAGDNWKKHQEEQEAKQKRLEKKERVKKERDAAARNVKMAGKGLADIEDDIDTVSWLKGQSKRVKKLEKEQSLAAELLAQKKRPEYTALDLAGVKVGHELGEFDAGSEQILTLKDAEIGEGSEEDELEAGDLRQIEKTQKRLDAKKRRNVYNPMDVDESGENTLLAQYDEEIEGEKRHRFTLDGQGSTKEKARLDREANVKNSKGVLVSLDILKEDRPISDYKDVSQIKIRKPKKEKSKATRKKAVNEIEIGQASNGNESMGIAPDVGPVAFKKRSLTDANFVDDEELQDQLARQRRLALKKRKIIRPQDLARKMREEDEAAMEGVEDGVEDEGGLIIDETSEFVQNLQPEDSDAEEEVKKARIRRSIEQGTHTPTGLPVSPRSDADGDVDMDSYASLEATERVSKQVKREASPAAQEISTTGLEEEASLNNGLGATLGMLRRRGLIKESNAAEQNSALRDREHFLAEREGRRDEAEARARSQRERDRTSGRLDRMSAREREDFARQSNANREQQESRQMQELFFNGYRPKVELKYHDEDGRQMNPKEAFKYLSHEFHGKGSGKQKHEKRLKKIENEKKREAASLLDSSQHVSASAMDDRAKRNKQAGVRLQ